MGTWARPGLRDSCAPPQTRLAGNIHRPYHEAGLLLLPRRTVMSRKLAPPARSHTASKGESGF